MKNSRNIASFAAYYRAREASSKHMMRRLLSGTGADWENIHHEVWRKVFEKYFEHGFVLKIGLDQYLNTCIYNAAKDYLKRYLTREQTVEFDEGAELFGDASQSDIDQLVERLSAPTESSNVTQIKFNLNDPASWDDRNLADAVEALPPQQRAVVLFWAWHEPPPTDREIAKEFGIAEGTAKTHRRRAIANLRQVLRSPEPGEKEKSN